MIRLRCVFAMLFCILCTGARAQEPPRELTHLRDRAEERYEQILSNALGQHYDPRSFIIDARVAIEERLKEESRRIDTGISELPGLPYLPPELKERDSSVVDSIFEYSLGRVSVEVLVDSGYSMEDFDFIRRIIYMSGNLTNRDNISLEKRHFPRLNRKIDSKDTVIPAEDTPDETEEAPAELPPLWLIITGILFLLVVLFLIFRRSAKRTPAPQVDEDNPLAHRIDEVTRKIDSLVSQNTQNDSSGGDDLQRISALRRRAVHAFIGSPRVSAAVLANWAENDGQEGLEKAAALIRAVDPSSADILRRRLGSDQMRLLRRYVSGEDESAAAPSPELYKAFLRDFNLVTVDSEGQDSEDIFSFLGDLTDEQVLHLIKDERENVQSLVLTQMDSERAGRIMRWFDDGQRSRILLGIGSIQDIPLDMYKTVAANLSQKALSVSGMRTVRADGVAAAVDMLFSFPVSEHMKYIKTISESNLDLARRIRRFFATFQELPTLDPKLLRKVLQQVDNDSIATALVGMKQDSVQSLLKHLPDRMQELIVSSIASKGETKPDQVEAARKTLLKAVQKELHAVGGRKL
ncbi:MAG: FliG C-terminal domain-containing protein [Fibrobacterota bacterium]